MHRERNKYWHAPTLETIRTVISVSRHKDSLPCEKNGTPCKVSMACLAALGSLNAIRAHAHSDSGCDSFSKSWTLIATVVNPRSVRTVFKSSCVAISESSAGKFETLIQQSRSIWMTPAGWLKPGSLFGRVENNSLEPMLVVATCAGSNRHLESLAMAVVRCDFAVNESLQLCETLTK